MTSRIKNTAALLTVLLVGCAPVYGSGVERPPGGGAPVDWANVPITGGTMANVGVTGGSIASPILEGSDLKGVVTRATNAGEIGEATNVVGVATAMATAVPATVTTITLNRGIYSLYTGVTILPAATTSVTRFITGVTLASGTFTHLIANYNTTYTSAAQVWGALAMSPPPSKYYVRVTADGTVINGTCNVTFTVSTLTCKLNMFAIRER